MFLFEASLVQITGPEVVKISQQGISNLLYFPLNNVVFVYNPAYMYMYVHVYIE